MGTLASDIGIAPSTLSVHVQRLAADGLVQISVDGKRRIIAATPELRHVDLEEARRPPRPARRESLADRIQRLAPRIRALAKKRGATEIRVFGSVGRKEENAASDIDFLIKPGPDFGLLDQAGLLADLEDLLGARIDLVTDKALHPRLAQRILAEARTL
jgi:hypothetical protein